MLLEVAELEAFIHALRCGAQLVPADRALRPIFITTGGVRSLLPPAAFLLTLDEIIVTAEQTARLALVGFELPRDLLFSPADRTGRSQIFHDQRFQGYLLMFEELRGEHELGALLLLHSGLLSLDVHDLLISGEENYIGAHNLATEL